MEKYETTGQRLYFIRKKILKIPREVLAKSLEVSSKSIENWENGVFPIKSTIPQKIWDKYHDRLRQEDYIWFLTGTRVEYKEAVSIPVFGHVPAGFPEIVEEEVIEYITLPEAQKGCFAVIVHGNSMEPDIRDGDYAIFIPIEKADVRPGDVVVALNEFNQTMLKRYVVDREGTAWLKSDNPIRKPIKANENHTIVGKVKETWRKHKV